MAMIAHLLQSSFAIDLLFQASQCLLNGLSFFKAYLCQFISLPLFIAEGILLSFGPQSDLGIGRVEASLGAVNKSS